MSKKNEPGFISVQFYVSCCKCVRGEGIIFYTPKQHIDTIEQFEDYLKKIGWKYNKKWFCPFCEESKSENHD